MLEATDSQDGAARSQARAGRSQGEAGRSSDATELERRIAELERAYQEVTVQRDDLSTELEETNRGVVALYNEEHQLAVMLQRTFLPASLPAVPGVELAVRYLPAASGNEIGGDFYEAIDTPLGLLLAVGDVAGHSLQAAIIMGELRHGLRAYASEGHPLHALLELLDRLLTLYRPGWSATVCIVLIEADTGRLHVANGGHLPPLLLTPDGRARYLHEHGPLLGLGLPQPAATIHLFAPGSRLLMVTDGLIEVPGDHLDQGLADLSRAASRDPGDLETLCDTLVKTFASQQIDDIVIFTARLEARELS